MKSTRFIQLMLAPLVLALALGAAAPLRGAEEQGASSADPRKAAVNAPSPEDSSRSVRNQPANPPRPEAADNESKSEEDKRGSASPPKADPPKPNPDRGRRGDSRNNSDLARRWLNRLRGVRPSTQVGKNHETVKTAFRKVVEPASMSTVRIESDGKTVALGAIVTADGFILSKASELEGNLVCRTRSGRKLPARIVGVKPRHDLAMLKVQAVGLRPVRWSESSAPPVGSLLATATTANFPLAIGVVSVAPRRIVAHPGILGIIIEENKEGPSIKEIMPDSGAEKAGLKVGDLVLRVDDKKTGNRKTLVDTIHRYKAGQTIRLRIKRGDKEMNLTATLGDRFTGSLSQGADQNTAGGPISERRGDFPEVLQHDTALRPQDCGGPVVDLNGRVIGINIARAGRVASYALPAAVILPLLADLKSGKLAPKTGSVAPKIDTEKRTRLLAEIDKKIADLEATHGRVVAKMAAADKAVRTATDALKQAQQTPDEAERAVRTAANVLQQAQQTRDEVEKAVKRAKAAIERAKAEKTEIEQDKAAQGAG